MRISDWSSDVCSSDLIKVGSLPSGDGGVPDDGTVTAAKITADTGEQAALRVKIGAASSTALTALDGTVSDLSGTVTTQGTTVGALQTALVAIQSDVATVTGALASGIAAPYDTWADLEAVTPTADGKRGDVIPTDDGTQDRKSTRLNSSH